MNIIVPILGGLLVVAIAIGLPLWLMMRSGAEMDRTDDATLKEIEKWRNGK